MYYLNSSYSFVIDINQMDLFFFAVIITSDQEQFMTGARHVLIRLLQISYKYGSCSLFTGKCNFTVVLGWGTCMCTFLSPTVEFLYEPPSTP